MSSLTSRATWTLSDREWSNVKKYVNLPEAARPDVEGAIAVFRRHTLIDKKKPATKQFRSRLEGVSLAAKQLVMMIEQLTDHERFELRTSNFYWPEFEDQPSEALEAHISEILRDTVAKATLLCELIGDTVVYPAVYSKKFPRALNRLVESLDRTLARHVPGLRVSRAKSTMAMLLAVVEIADPSVSGGSVEEAVKRLGQARGGYAPKPGSNPPQNSGRKSKRTQ